MTEYILIYDANGVGPNSRDDLKTLFTEYDIYPNPTIQFTNFKSNFDGLDPLTTTIIIPGGSVFQIGASLKNEKMKIQGLFKDGCKGVFICAGAYLAANNAEIFYDGYKRNHENDFFPLPFGLNITNADMSLNLMPGYKAIGSFIPNDSYNHYLDTHPDKTLRAKVKKPYCVDLLFNHTQQSLKQMYLGGCGFKAIENTQINTCEIIATYQDRPHYTFFKPSREPEKIFNMPAIIRNLEQGIFLSGPHIETCVRDSKLLKLMQDGDATTVPISEINEYDSSASADIVVPLLRETLNISR